MPVINPDTSQAQEMGPIEPGTYPAKIMSVISKNSKAGNPMLEIALELAVEGKTRTRKTWVVTSGEGAFNFDQLLRATGFAALADQYKDPTADHPGFDTDDLIGQEVNVIVESNLYQGQMRDQIRGFQKA